MNGNRRGSRSFNALGNRKLKMKIRAKVRPVEKQKRTSNEHKKPRSKKSVSNKDNVMNILTLVTGSAFNTTIFFASLVLIFVVSSQAFEYGKNMMTSTKSDKEAKEIVVTIPENSSSSEIARILKDNDLIDNETFFLVQSKINGTAKYFKSGTHVLNANMDGDKLMLALQTPTEDLLGEDVKVTIPEGLNLKQMAALFESKELFTSAEFLEACENGVYEYSFLEGLAERANKLEGYLFPDTYFFSKDSSPDEVINRLLTQFETVYDSELKALTSEKGLTTHEVITMASIIEKEIQKPEERALASSVIHNRLKQNIKLQMCSTIIYVLEKRKDRLVDTDLEIDSPYNTYLHEGLPVGPIASPGKSSILAVLRPDSTPYLYFVLKDTTSGEHIFTESYEEFLEAKELYNQKY